MSYTIEDMFVKALLVQDGTTQQKAGDRILVAFNIVLDPADLYNDKIGSYK